LRDAKFFGRQPKIEMPCHDLEHAQAVERGETSETFCHEIVFL
jgi:hypothetical protein